MQTATSLRQVGQLCENLGIMMQTFKPESQVAPDPLRRRLARGGVASTVVLGSLISKPVLGNVAYQCTISGQLSGNTSSHGSGPVNCQVGKSPGYWKTDSSNWPTVVKKGVMPHLVGSVCTFTSTDKGTRFNGFTSGTASLPANVFKWLQTCPTNNQAVVNASGTPQATMLQVLWQGGGSDNGDIYELGRHTVASILNAFAFPGTFPLTAEKVIKMFNAVYAGQKYDALGNGTVLWNQAQVIAYFKSLQS